MKADPGYNQVIGADGENLIPEKERVMLLHRPLYGLRSAPELYSSTARRILEDDGFTPSAADPCVFIKKLVNADGSPKMVQTRRPVFHTEANDKKSQWSTTTPLRVNDGDSAPKFQTVQEQDEYIVLLYVDDVYAVSPTGGAIPYLQKLLKRHGFEKESRLLAGKQTHSSAC